MTDIDSIKPIAAEIFKNHINQATEWIVLPEPVCEVETSKGKFSVVAQIFVTDERRYFCGDYYSSPNICFVWLGDPENIPIAKVGKHG